MAVVMPLPGIHLELVEALAGCKVRCVTTSKTKKIHAMMVHMAKT